MAMFEITLAEAKTRAIRAMEVGLVPLFKSAPGLGKSSLAKQIAKDFNLKLIDLRLSQMQDVDFMGIPFRDGDTAKFLHFNELFPVAGTPVPEGYNGWLLFLDELTSMSRSVEAAAYKLILDRMIGDMRLHESVYMMAAGNRETDKAVARKLGTALQSRVIHYTIRADTAQWLEHAIKANFDYRVTGFISYLEDMLHKFNPDHTDETFPCPRTWEFVSILIDGIETENLSLPELAGTVGASAATQFNEYVKVYADLPKFTEICAYPTKTILPSDQATRHAVVSMMIAKMTPKNFVDVVPYVDRLSAEFQVVFYRALGTKFPDLKETKDFIKATRQLTEFLYVPTTAQAA